MTEFPPLNKKKRIGSNIWKWKKWKISVSRHNIDSSPLKLTTQYIRNSKKMGDTNRRASIFRFNNWKLEADRYTGEVFIYLLLSGHLRVYNPFFTYVIASLKHHFPLPLISTVATPTASLSRYSPIAHSRRVIPDYSQSPYLTLLPYKSSGRAVCSRYVAHPFGLVPGRSSEEREPISE